MTPSFDSSLSRCILLSQILGYISCLSLPFCSCKSHVPKTSCQVFYVSIQVTQNTTMKHPPPHSVPAYRTPKVHPPPCLPTIQRNRGRRQVGHYKDRSVGTEGRRQFLRGGSCSQLKVQLIAYFFHQRTCFFARNAVCKIFLAICTRFIKLKVHVPRLREMKNLSALPSQGRTRCGTN